MLWALRDMNRVRHRALTSFSCNQPEASPSSPPLGSKGEVQEHPSPRAGARARCLQERAGDANPSSRPPCPEGLKGTRTLRERRGRSVSYFRCWAREGGQREAESKQTNKQTGGHAVILAQSPPRRGSRAGPRHPSREGVMRRMCRELAAACGPRAAVPGPGRHPSHGAARQRERGARFQISFPLLETELRKHQAQGVKSAMPVRQATEMDLAAGPGAKGTCPGYRTDQRGASRQAAHRGGAAGTSLTRPLALSRLFPLSGCRLYLQLHRKQRGRRRAERESPISG